MMRLLAGCGAFACMIFGASSAKALEPGQCLPMAEMNSSLRAEGMRTILVGNRLDPERQPVTFSGWTMTRAEWRDLTRDIRANGPQRRRIADGLREGGRSDAHIDAFFVRLLGVSEILEQGDPAAPIPRLMTAIVATEGGSEAYVLEGDKPAGEASTRACIRAKLNNVRLPAASGSVLLDARGDVQQLNGTIIRSLTVSLRGTTQSAMFVAVDPGRTAPLFYMSGVEFTPVGSARRGM